MSNWTQGEWEVGPRVESNNWIEYTVGIYYGDVCGVRGTTSSMVDWLAPASEAKANAQLISAAPDLAESTQWLLDAIHALLSSKPLRDMDERISFAESALRKARGE